MPKFKIPIVLILSGIVFLAITDFMDQNFITDFIRSERLTFPSDENVCRKTLDNSSQYFIEIDGSLYPKSVPIYLNKSINFKCLTQQPIKRILLWNTFWKIEDWGHGLGAVEAFRKNNCPVTNCELTTDKSLINQSDYVVVHMIYEVDPIQNIPHNRPPNQYWIFSLFESPLTHVNDFAQYNQVFNLTSTYQISSNFNSAYQAHALFEWQRNDSFDVSHDFSRGKTKLAAAIISNCNDKSKRIEYIRALNKSIRVELFGNCGTPCPKDYGRLGRNCKEIIARDYKFYLAFENSFCDDYITEKFFQALNLNIVPVVMGSGPYDYYVPKSAYIDVKDFASPHDLADYLKYLDSNKTAYNSYFAWKQHITYTGKYFPLSIFCEMCIKLQLDAGTPVRPSLFDTSRFWNRSINCKSFEKKN